jgi:putative oxygen-independent coproporphyrinogen III oxidase
MVHAAYLHIPFCEHICHYCNFNKFFLKGQPVEDYLDYMELEMKNTIESFPTKELNSIFVGGGTPTALNIHQLEQFLASIHKYLLPLSNEKLEFTFEVNPGGEFIKEKLQLLKDSGVNRISFGVQTFDDTLLEKIGRTHRKNEVFQTIHAAKEIGFDNISIDLMFALPGQTIENFRETLAIAFTLGMNHFSAYSLIIESKTVFYNLLKKGKLILPSQDAEATMYEILMEEMDMHGYKQYEISNFAIPGYESKHNLTYWNNAEYYGIGAGAHSYVDGVRKANAGPLKKYMSKITEMNFPYIDQKRVNTKEMMEEEMFLGLRKIEGVSKENFFRKFNHKLEEIFGDEIEKLIFNGLLEEDEVFVRLTHKGKFLGNEVFQAFI